MTTPQILSFAVIFAMMAAFIWGRFRYDVVAAVALLVAVGVGVVPFAMRRAVGTVVPEIATSESSAGWNAHPGLTHAVLPIWLYIRSDGGASTGALKPLLPAPGKIVHGDFPEILPKRSG